MKAEGRRRGSLQRLVRPTTSLRKGHKMCQFAEESINRPIDQSTNQPDQPVFCCLRRFASRGDTSRKPMQLSARSSLGVTSSRPPKKSEIARPHQGVARVWCGCRGKKIQCCGCLTVARHERFANSSRPIGPVGTPPDPHRCVAHGAGLPPVAVGERYLGSSARTRAGKGRGSRTPRLNVWSRTSLCVVEVERACAALPAAASRREARRKSTTH